MSVYIILFVVFIVLGLISLTGFLLRREANIRKKMTSDMSDYNKLQYIGQRNRKVALTITLLIIPIAILSVIGFGILVNIGAENIKR